MTRTSGSLRGNPAGGPVAAAARGVVTCDISTSFQTETTAGRVTTGMAYTYSTLLVCFRAFRVEITMFIRAKQSWFRRVAVAATALATVALCIGPLAQSATAQVYPGYSSAPSQTYPGYSSPGYSAPGYSYQAPTAPAQGYAGYGYSGAYPGYGYSGAYPGYGYSGAYPGYGYSGAYPYYPYPYWGCLLYTSPSPRDRG